MLHLTIPRASGCLAVLIATGCTGVFSSTGGTFQSAVEDAGTTAQPPEIPGLIAPSRRLRRLSNREYNNTVRDLLGDATRPANRFIIDAFRNGYDNGSAGLAVQSDQVVDYQAAAESLSQAALKNGWSRVLNGCNPAQQGQLACIAAFLDGFAHRAFRRPLTPTERQRLADVIQAASQTGGFDTGIQAALEVVLQSPQFLYREELGPLDTVPAAGAAVRLTNYEVASELSYLLTGSIPDDTLRSAVESNHFETVTDYQREAARLLATPGARDALRAFLHQWLSTDRLATLSKDPAFYPTFNSAMAASMSGELDRFYDDVLWNGAGSLRELFVTNRSFIDGTLATLYGVKAVGPGFSPVTLDPGLRKGVLGRAGFLAVHAATDSSGPIARGVFILDSLLCVPPPQPPANVPPAVPAGDTMVKNLTTRERFEQHVSSPFCAGCHKQIDGIGFGLESLDGIGAFRTMEHGQPIDSHGTIVGTNEIDGDYNGISELADRLAGSRHLADCFLRQGYRYAMGEIEPASDDLRVLDNHFTSDARITSVLLSLIRNPVFVTRAFESPNP